MLSLAGGAAWANHIHMHEGPFGGIVLGVTVDRVNPQVLYAVVFGGGVFKSASAGQMWTGINRGLENTRVFWLVQDPSMPSVLYVGTDAGVFKTTSGGDQWFPARQGLEERNIRALVFDPQRPSRLLAATDAGVYRSDDGGGHWSPTREGLDHLDVRALAIDPTDPDSLYAATFGGIFTSRDGGRTWRPTQAQPADRHVRALAIDPLNPMTVYVGSARGGVSQTVDGGATWITVNEGLGNTSVLSLTAAPTAPATLYAGTVLGLYRRRDQDTRWTLLGEGRLLSITAIAPDPHHVNNLYVGTGGLVLKSADVGQTWTDLSQWVLNPTPMRSSTQVSGSSPAPVTTPY
ncbi:MAG: WD40/YVTN/BNR-like repeat-containing protein [Candidatus Entotheonellia bacterium]